MVTCELGFRIKKDVRRFASCVGQTKILLDVHGQKISIQTKGSPGANAQTSALETPNDNQFT